MGLALGSCSKMHSPSTLHRTCATRLLPQDPWQLAVANTRTFQSAYSGLYVWLFGCCSSCPCPALHTAVHG